ncbi:hypothetical protein [Maridesulfovibrio bastinii]|uniref:hypothetical protein n=1 Tax=Maridesulfovibrio bastinii TaxID=47157 RepID=UPI0004037F30|nr:hypothetical protein [Maridesulfovibrio bastinii]
MADTLKLLDQALEIGRKELRALETGDVDSAEVLCFERDRLTNEALQNKGRTDFDAKLERVDGLRELQKQITEEARKLHSQLKTEILSVKKKTKVFSAYGGSLRGGKKFANRYLNKTG